MSWKDVMDTTPAQAAMLLEYKRRENERQQHMMEGARHGRR